MLGNATLIESLKNLAGLFGSFLTIFSFITVVCRPFRRKVIKWVQKTAFSGEHENAIKDVREMLKEQNQSIGEMRGKIDNIQFQVDNIATGSQASLRNQILDITNRCIKRGDITQLERKNLIDLHTAYTNLKGNSYEHAEYDMAMELPVSDR